MGYSPLTGEKLTPDEPASIAQWSDQEILQYSSTNRSVACEAGPALESALEEEWSSRASGHVEGRLIALVSVLPPSSLARAKAALALGLSYLRGVERSREENAAAISFDDEVTVLQPLFTRVKQTLRHGRKALYAATQELRLAEMLLFEAACVLEQHNTTEPVLFQSTGKIFRFCLACHITKRQNCLRWIYRSTHIVMNVHWIQ